MFLVGVLGLYKKRRRVTKLIQSLYLYCSKRNVTVMTFYLKPPRGFANLNSLEDAVRQRILCYDQLFSDNITTVITKLECLIEDTVLDRLGHYLFRLVSLRSNRFASVFIKHEVKLLDTRLNSYNSTDAKYIVRKLRKHANECLQLVTVEGKVKEFYSLLTRLTVQLLRKDFFAHAVKHHDNICDQCNAYHFRVPFDLCLDLVASREYEINYGLINVYSFQWKHLFVSLYKTYLNLVLKEMRYSSTVRSAMEEERIKNIIALTEDVFAKGSLQNADSKQGSFKLSSFETEFKHFPPCMRNLYNVLKQNNRLSHNARYDFSLYLKGIGLSMNDALYFWETTYSRAHSSCSKCTHSWQKNEKKYIYSIRHLYGLEGSRRNYTVRSCQQLQDMSLTAGEEGGCPFRHCDDDSLRNMLRQYLPLDSANHIETIIHERRKNFTAGCKLFVSEYLNKIHQKDVSDDEVTYFDPVQYYTLVKKQVTEQSSIA